MSDCFPLLVGCGCHRASPHPLAALHTTPRATNVTFQPHKVDRAERSAILGRHRGFRGCTLWLTGLSGAGKTSIAFEAERILVEMGIPVCGLDGDNVRHGLCKNLGFLKEDREENIRRVAEVAKLFADLGVVCLASFISPYASGRNEARAIHKAAKLPFFEVYVNTSLEVCEWRDTKNLYKKARAGEICGFTGVDGIYEEPRKPDLRIDAGGESIEASTRKLIAFLFQKGIVPFLPYPTAISEMPSTSISTIAISESEAKWVQILANGWLDPLRGFMTEQQYLQTIQHGAIFTPVLAAFKTPIAIRLDSEIEAGKPIALVFDKRIIAKIPLPEIFKSQDHSSFLLGGDIVPTSHAFSNPLLRAPNELRKQIAAVDQDSTAAIFLRSAIDNNQAVRIDEAREILREKGFGSTAIIVFVEDEAEFLRSEEVADPETTKVVLMHVETEDLLLRARLAKAVGARVLLSEQKFEGNLKVAPGLEDVELVDL
ncbi:hypothetical protein L596_018846 [Steinernema carpocapsae]|uniref:adenylyl-sulfate kinase n=1 Tax=Steinernema carpocapsae TaxID=34508 RepID=A0A4U5N6Y8_STECR|nr:hypothetical protein L596_018846 [Steinernema carpocapsae]